MLTLREKGFKSNFKGVFELDCLNEDEARRKILKFINEVIKVEYKKSEELDIVEEQEKYFEFLNNYFLIEINSLNKLGIKGIKDSFIEKYKRDIIGLFSEVEIKEVKYNYKHFYFLNVRKISSALRLLGIRDYNYDLVNLLLKRFNISEEMKEFYKEYTEMFEKNENMIGMPQSYFNQVSYGNIKSIKQLTLDGTMQRNLKEIDNLKLEKKTIEKYFENNALYNFEEIIKLVENDPYFYLKEEHKRKGIEFLRYLLNQEFKDI